MVRKLIYTALVMMLLACSGTKENELIINIEDVDQISISGYCGPTDTCMKAQYRWYELNETRSENLVKKLNAATSTDPSCFEEYLPQYELYIELKDGASRDFKMIGEKILEGKDNCYEIDEQDYFKNLWVTLDKEWLKLNEE